jgi:hypothetical protein
VTAIEVPWIQFTDHPFAMACRRCGEMSVLPLPISAKEYAVRTERFAAKHSKCEERCQKKAGPASGFNDPSKS